MKDRAEKKRRTPHIDLGKSFAFQRWKRSLFDDVANVQSIPALEWGIAKWKLSADWGLCPRPANLKSNFYLTALTTLLGFFCGLISLHLLAPVALSSGFCPTYTLPGHSLRLLWLQSPPKKLMFSKPSSLVQTCALITSSNHLISLLTSLVPEIKILWI